MAPTGHRRYRNQVLKEFVDAKCEAYESDGKRHFQVFTSKEILGYGSTAESAWKMVFLLKQKPRHVRIE
jgi:hypothetical protein